MNVQKRNNNVSIYCLSSGTAIPEWLGDQGRRNLAKRDESVRRRIELVQDFNMPASSSKLVASNDGRFVFAAGVYPPRIRCFDLYEFGMKFERYVDATVVDMCMLGDDYGKLALLMDDRTISFHAPYGAHTSIRVPKFGRALAYECTTCELLVAARGPEVYRINLEEGRFSEPWDNSKHGNSNSSNNSKGPSSNCISVHPRHPLAAVGCDDGLIRMWDARDDVMHLTLDVATAVQGYGHAYMNTGSSIRSANEITSMAFDTSGLYMTAGTYGGVVALYDIRSSRPLYVQEHKQGLPIHTVRFHTDSQMVLSSDEKLIKCWRYKPGSSNSYAGDGDIDSSIDINKKADSTSLGATLVNIEGNNCNIQNFIVAGDEHDPTGNSSGLIMCATDQPKMDCFYVPALGTAPRWCSYIENITEELEERDLQRGDGSTDVLVKDGQETIYENYKFVTSQDLESLGVSNLIGTPLLRGYMHGFFMDINLYNRVKSVANPFEYEEYKKKKLQERLAAKRGSRIAPRNDKSKATTAVNAELAERLERKASKSNKIAGNLLQDDRFGTLFSNPDFTIDKEAEDFKLRNPSGMAANKFKNEKFDSDDEDEVDDDDDDNSNDDADAVDEMNNDSDNDASNDSEEDEIGFKVRGEAYEEMKDLERKIREQKKLPKSKVSKPHKKQSKAPKARLITATDNIGFAKARQEQLQKPLSERLREQEPVQKKVVRGTGGNKEVSFVVRDKKKRNDNKHGQDKRQRRGVQDLRLKKQKQY